MTSAAPRAPDLVLHNGRVITVDSAFTVAEAVAVRAGRIVGVGGGAGMLAAAQDHTRVIDLQGRAVVPGLTDGHAHMDREGLKEIYPSLAGARSIAEVQEIIRTLAAGAAPGQWIVTMPIGEPPEYRGVPENLVEGRFPTRHDLDRVAPDNPVYIRAIWGYWRHDGTPLVSIANSHALAAAGITRDTPSPCPSVTIEKDGAGEPTGVFVEDTIEPIVELTLMRAAGGFSHADRVRGLRRSMAAYSSFGTTAVYEGHGAAAELVDAYKAVYAAGDMTVRALMPLSPSWHGMNDTDMARLLDNWAGWLSGPGLGDCWFRVSGLYVNHREPGSRLAEEDALRIRAKPYTGWGGRNYDDALPRERLVELMAEAARRNIRVAAITTPMLDILIEADRIAPIAGKRWVLGHISTLTEDQVAKVRDLGLVVTTHTNHHLHRKGSHWRDQLGRDRENDIVPLRRLHDAGVSFAFATDNVPVSLWHPVWQAVARVDRDTGEVISPDQRLSREQALRAATMGGAFLTETEAERGSIETGKLADLVVLDADPLTVKDDALKGIAAHTTIVGGRIVHGQGTEGE